MSKFRTNPNQKRYRQRKERRKKERGKTYLTYGGFVLGILAAAALINLFSQMMITQEKFKFRQDEIVYGEPIHAVHEMSGSQISSIPFYSGAKPQPRIQATHLYYNLGSIGAQEVVTHEIAIKNIGEAPLIISRAFTTCGCTTAHITASELQPGEVALVTLTLDAGYHDVRGQTVRRGLIIESNDSNSPEMTFWMEANVRTTS